MAKMRGSLSPAERTRLSPALKPGYACFRQITDIITGEAVPNMVSGHNVPFWFLGQAIYHGPIGWVMLPLSRLKRRISALAGRNGT